MVGSLGMRKSRNCAPKQTCAERQGDLGKLGSSLYRGAEDVGPVSVRFRRRGLRLFRRRGFWLRNRRGFWLRNRRRFWLFGRRWFWLRLWSAVPVRAIRALGAAAVRPRVG
jgi:hypothetical protein